MSKEFTKSDLRNGDVILKANGEVEIVCVDTGTLISLSGFNSLLDIREDLTDKYSDDDDNYDIIAVRRPTEVCDCQFCAFDEELGELVYDRNRDENKVEAMTMFEEIYKALGEAIKIAKGH